MGMIGNVGVEEEETMCEEQAEPTEYKEFVLELTVDCSYSGSTLGGGGEREKKEKGREERRGEGHTHVNWISFKKD